jgi:hypothetical protein
MQKFFLGLVIHIRRTPRIRSINISDHRIMASVDQRIQ